jgi:hypothetical protein
VNQIYFSYNEINFEFLVQTFAGQRGLIDPRVDKLIMSSCGWDNQVSQIKLIDLNNYEESKLEIDANQIEALLEIDTKTSNSGNSTTTESLSAVLPTFSLFSSVGIVITISIISKKNK